MKTIIEHSIVNSSNCSKLRIAFLSSKTIVHLAVSAVLALMATLHLQAGDTYDAKELRKPIIYQETEQPYFRANEWSGDIFGTYADLYKRGGTKFYHDGFGAGIGGNYYFTRNFGLGIESEGWDGSHGGVAALEANLLLRWPIEDIHLAPYAFLGGGYDFGDIGSWKGDLGLGLEYRFTPHIGLFADGRYVLVDKASVNNYDLARVGVRFAF
jgi:hypothetical protein